MSIASSASLVDSSKLAADHETLDRCRAATAFRASGGIESAASAWVYGTLKYGDAQVRSGYIMVGLVKTMGLRNILYGISKEFEKLGIDALSEKLPDIVKGSPEEALAASDGSGLGGEPGEASGAMAPAQMGKQEALKKYAIDLTEKAKKGELDPVTGRDEEIRQIVDILMRRRQNNPILTGEAGVGKTAVVEGCTSSGQGRRASVRKTFRC